VPEVSPAAKHHPARQEHGVALERARCVLAEKVTKGGIGKISRFWLSVHTELDQGTQSLKQCLFPGGGSLGEYFDRLGAVI